jgi:tRNA nucleotidyltransferase (CCA-adding enzyme)
MVLVGGCVRDYFLKIAIKDYDIEVYGLDSLDALERILLRYGDVKSVGKSFGILKFIYEGRAYDFAFPRLERKVGRGHRGFAVEVDGMLDFATAARRRDFTINAMGYDIEADLFLDPFNGKKDLENGILRHVDAKTFIEDPLRLYRGIQFCARFDLEMDSATEELCRRMTSEGMLEELPKERVFDEWKKLLLKAEKPSVGFTLLKRLDAIAYFPQLQTLSEDLWRKTLKSVDMMAILRPKDSKKALILMLAALCSRCKSHAICDMIALLSDEKGLCKKVSALCEHVKVVEEIYRKRENKAYADTLIRKLSCVVEIADILLLAKALFWADHEEEIRFEAGIWVKKRAEVLGVLHAKPLPLVQGRDLVEILHLKPSAEFKKILDRLYALQLEGKIASKEEGLEMIRRGEI